MKNSILMALGLRKIPEIKRRPERPVIGGMVVLIVVAATLWSDVCVAADVPPGYIAVPRGLCLVATRPDNQGVVEEVAPVCEQTSHRIYRQLGVALPERGPTQSPLFQLRIAATIDELSALAPEPVPRWARAVAFPSRRIIVLPLSGKGAFSSNELLRSLAHEISHMAFHVATDGAKVPRWFSEGVAILQSEGSSVERSASLWWASWLDDIPSLADIARYPVHSADAVNAYAQSAHFIGFVVDAHGWPAIQRILLYLKRGMTFEDAFAQGTGVSVSNMETRWRHHLTGGREWLWHVTGNGLWLGMAALLAIVAFVSVRRRQRRRMTQMAVEEAAVDALLDRPGPSDDTES